MWSPAAAEPAFEFASVLFAVDEAAAGGEADDALTAEGAAEAEAAVEAVAVAVAVVVAVAAVEPEAEAAGVATDADANADAPDAVTA